MNVVTVLSAYCEQPISIQVLLGLLKDYNRPYDKIVEMVQKGY